MRHFSPVALTLTPATLPLGMLGATARRALVAPPGLAQRATTLKCRTALETIDVFVIAAPTQAHLLLTPGAVVKPIVRLDRHRSIPAEALDSAALSRHPLHSGWSVEAVLTANTKKARGIALPRAFAISAYCVCYRGNSALASTQHRLTSSL